MTKKLTNAQTVAMLCEKYSLKELLHKLNIMGMGHSYGKMTTEHMNICKAINKKCKMLLREIRIAQTSREKKPMITVIPR